MKRILFLLCGVLFYTGFCMADASYLYTPLVREGVVWVYLYNDIDEMSTDNNYTSYKLQFSGIETIDDIEYHKLYRYTNSINLDDAPVAYMREDEDKVVYCRLTTGQPEQILYDFGNPADFYPNRYTRWHGLTIADVSTVEYGGATHNCYSFNVLTETNLIEGIGFDYGDANLYAPVMEDVPDCICPYTIGLIELQDVDGNTIYKTKHYSKFISLLSGITDLKADSTKDSYYYDLQGRPVIRPEQGTLYIHGGKVIRYFRPSE